MWCLSRLVSTSLLEWILWVHTTSFYSQLPAKYSSAVTFLTTPTFPVQTTLSVNELVNDIGMAEDPLENSLNSLQDDSVRPPIVPNVDSDDDDDDESTRENIKASVESDTCDHSPDTNSNTDSVYVGSEKHQYSAMKKKQVMVSIHCSYCHRNDMVLDWGKGKHATTHVSTTLPSIFDPVNMP